MPISPMRRAALALLVALVAVVGVLWPSTVASAAAPAPFTDPNQRGAIGLCDASGHEVTSGRIDVAPFTWYAVSSSAAPAGYGKAQKGKANLFAYQPIKDVNPGDWSGRFMTAASDFAADAHPMAAGTVLDPALEDFVGAYPLKFDGLVQLRIIYTAPDKSAYDGGYPAAVVRVDGTSWSLVSGGGVPCSGAKAQSVEHQRLPSSAFASPGRPAPAADVAKAVASAGRSATASGSRATASTSTSGASDNTVSNVARSSGNGSSGSTALVTTLVALAVAAGAIAFWWWRRRQVAG